MKIAKYVLPVIAAGFVASSASAAIFASNTVDGGLAGVTQNNWTVTTDTDFLSAAVFVELTSGTLFNPFSVIEIVDGSVLGYFGDTFVTANDSFNSGIAGGAGGELTGAPLAETFGPTLLSVHWFSPGADTDDIGTGLPIGRFSFTDDATGTWQLLVLSAADNQQLLSGDVIGGEMVPEPASAVPMIVGVLAICRHRSV